MWIKLDWGLYECDRKTLKIGNTFQLQIVPYAHYILDCGTFHGKMVYGVRADRVENNSCCKALCSVSNLDSLQEDKIISMNRKKGDDWCKEGSVARKSHAYTYAWYMLVCAFLLAARNVPYLALLAQQCKTHYATHGLQMSHRCYDLRQGYIHWHFDHCC